MYYYILNRKDIIVYTYEDYKEQLRYNNKVNEGTESYTVTSETSNKNAHTQINNIKNNNNSNTKEKNRRRKSKGNNRANRKEEEPMLAVLEMIDKENRMIRREGRKEGIRQKTEQVIKEMKKNNFSEEMIATITKVSKEEIQKIIKDC